MINLYIANITLLKCTRVLFYHLGDDRSMLNCFKTTKLGEGGPTKGFFFRISFLKIHLLIIMNCFWKGQPFWHWYFVYVIYLLVSWCKMMMIPLGKFWMFCHILAVWLLFYRSEEIYYKQEEADRESNTF